MRPDLGRQSDVVKAIIQSHFCKSTRVGEHHAMLSSFVFLWLASATNKVGMVF
jgi:hypothetical protein